MEKETIEKTLYKIKVVLEALWSNQNHPEACEIIEEFQKELKGIGY